MEFVHLDGDFEMICNQEGRLVCEKNCLVPAVAPNFKEEDYSFVVKPKNAARPGTVRFFKTFGTIIIARTKGKHNFVSMTKRDLTYWASAVLVTNELQRR